MDNEIDNEEFWAALEREDDARSKVLREMDGQIIDLNEVERRVQALLSE